jgi:hypothetical protein
MEVVKPLAEIGIARHEFHSRREKQGSRRAATTRLPDHAYNAR